MIQEIISLLKSYVTAFIHNWEMQACLLCLIALLSEVTGISLALMYIFFAVLFIDFVLGLTMAIKCHSFSSTNFKKGIVKIVLYVFYIILMSFGDRVFQEVFLLPTQRHYLAMWLTASIVFTELLSIIKHCRAIGLPIPRSMSFILSKAQKSFDLTVSESLECNPNKEICNDKS